MSRNQQRPDSHGPGPGPGPEPSCVSVNSDCSKEDIINFGLEPESLMSSFDILRSYQTPDLHGPGSRPRFASLQSDCSKEDIINFKADMSRSRLKQSAKSMWSNAFDITPLSVRSFQTADVQRPRTPNIRFLKVHPQSSESPGGPSAQQHQTQLDSIFQLLEDNILTFVKDELKKIQKLLSPDYPECCESQREDEEDEEQRRSRESFVQITVDFLRRMEQEELAERLQIRSAGPKLKSNLKEKFQCVFEGIAKAGEPTLLNQIYTELYITEGGTAGVNEDHEVRQIEAASRKAHRPETPIRPADLFKGRPGRQKPIRTVMTQGVAGIGKTVLTQKFSLDWAEDKDHQDVHFTFPFTFRELNVLREKQFSLVELVHHFFPETKEAGISSFQRLQVLFIFDGLDECRLPLDFHNTRVLTDVTQSTSVHVLLTNLIRGKLLPSARLWITTRPAAANQIPPDCVDMVTLIRGFTDAQKEVYFRRRFREEEQASRIISHIKTSRSLHIMCHMPLFCWITAEVLEQVLETREGEELPSTLTEMYIHFLVVHAKVKKFKYDGGSETDPHWSPENRKMIRSLGKLAYDQLQKGKLIFNESDLTERGIDIRAASVCSGVFTQIFKEERGLHQNKEFCFVHLTVQEFLAALYLYLYNHRATDDDEDGDDNDNDDDDGDDDDHHDHDNFGSAPEPCLENNTEESEYSKNGHLDLFARFHYGLSLQSIQKLLKGLLDQVENCLETIQRFINHKEMNTDEISTDRSINIFHCLMELSIVCTALAYILQMSEKVLDELHWDKYNKTEEGQWRLIPALRNCRKARYLRCGFNKTHGEVATALMPDSSPQTELNLSNKLQDTGMMQFSAGSESLHCRLKTLRLEDSMLSEISCDSLVSALRPNRSHFTTLEVSVKKLQGSGVKLCGFLQRPHCRLETLRADSMFYLCAAV